MVCSLAVHNTDFVHTEVGVSQAFYFMPLAPCQALMGQEIVDGGNPVWKPADATGNWGAALSARLPTSTESKSRWSLRIGSRNPRCCWAGCRRRRPSPITALVEEIVKQFGDKVPNLNLTDVAGVNATVQGGTVPVINITFPVPVVPVDHGSPSNGPIHAIAND